MSGRNERTVRRYIETLEALGDIEVEPQGGATSLYRINWHNLTWNYPREELNFQTVKKGSKEPSTGEIVADLVGIDIDALPQPEGPGGARNRYRTTTRTDCGPIKPRTTVSGHPGQRCPRTGQRCPTNPRNPK